MLLEIVLLVATLGLISTHLGLLYLLYRLLPLLHIPPVGHVEVEENPENDGWNQWHNIDVDNVDVPDPWAVPDVEVPDPDVIDIWGIPDEFDDVQSVIGTPPYLYSS